MEGNGLWDPADRDMLSRVIITVVGAALLVLVSGLRFRGSVGQRGLRAKSDPCL